MRYPKIDYTDESRWLEEKRLICGDAQAVLSLAGQGLDHGQIARCLGMYATYVRDLMALTRHDDVFRAFRDRDNAPFEAYYTLGKIDDDDARKELLDLMAGASNIGEAQSTWADATVESLANIRLP